MRADYMTPKEVAEKLGVCLDTVRQMAARGEIPMLKIGRKWIMLRKVFEAWKIKWDRRNGNG